MITVKIKIDWGIWRAARAKVNWDSDLYPIIAKLLQKWYKGEIEL